MPYWSIAEWRARIGSSWCALGRPQKIKSSIRHGARMVKKELTLKRVVTMMILLIMLVGVNIGIRGFVVGGHHHELISKYTSCRAMCTFNAYSDYSYNLVHLYTFRFV